MLENTVSLRLRLGFFKELNKSFTYPSDALHKVSGFSAGIIRALILKLGIVYLRGSIRIHLYTCLVQIYFTQPYVVPENLVG